MYKRQELPLIGHVQHRQRQPTGTPQHRSLQRRLHRRGVSFDQAACRIDSFQHTLKVGERRQVDGVEARFEQVDVDVDMTAVGRRAGGGPPRLAALRGRPPLPPYPGGRPPGVDSLSPPLMPEPLVLPLHPLTANALTCNDDTDRLTERLLGDRVFEGETGELA